jgi:hypothetical protein
MSQKLSADPFGDLGHYAISEGSKSVHPMGNPISHSTHVGFNSPPFAARTATARLVMVLRGPPFIRAFIAKCATGVFPSSCATGVGNHDPGSRERIEGAPWFAVAVGVCNHEESPPEMRRTNGCRRYARPFRVVPERGQVGEDSTKSKGKVAWDVFQECVSWS